MSCTYIYNGREYSRTGVLRALSQGPSAMSKSAMDFLTTKLGMSPSEVEVVTGLIDNKALGQFTEDGRILLSTMADDSVAYHEAFHRVFRMYLTPEERESYYKEFRKKSNYKQLLDKYRKDYGNNEEELIEEYFADEFADYVLNNGNVKVDPEAKSLFEKLIMFLKKLFGLNKKDVRKLYSQIERGDFARKYNKYDYVKPAYKVVIDNQEFDYIQKNDFVEFASSIFVESLINQDSIYGLINNNFSKDSIKSLLDYSVNTALQFIQNDDLLTAIYNDYNSADSYILDQIQGHLSGLIGKINIKTTAKVSDEIDVLDIVADNIAEQEGDVNTELGRANDDANNEFTRSVEIDIRLSMSRAVKLLLSTLDTNETSSIGTFRKLKWSQAFNKLSQELSGVPSQDLIKHLSTLQYPWVNDLVNQLGGVEIDSNISDDVLRLRNDFIKTFNLTTTTYLMSEITSDNIKLFDANQNTYQKRKLNEWSTAMQKVIANTPQGFSEWVNNLRALKNNSKSTIQQYENILGININDNLKEFDVLLNDHDWQGTLESIAIYILRSVDTNNFSNENPPNYTNLFGDKNFDIEGILKQLADKQKFYEDAVDNMVTARGKNFYSITQNTLTTNTINSLNYVARKIQANRTMTMNEKLSLVDKYLPGILNYQTINQVGDKIEINSIWLDHILKGNEIKLSVMLGIKNSKNEESDLSDIDELDLQSTTLNMALRGVNISMKHSDRSIFYAYQLVGKNMLFDDAKYSTKDAILNYLTSYFSAQLAAEIRRAKLPTHNIQYAKNNYNRSMLFPEFGALTELQINDKTNAAIKEKLSNAFNNYMKDLNYWGVLDKASKNKVLGLSDEYQGNIENEVVKAFANQLLSHLEEMKIFLGDFVGFKSADDFYKRMSTTSGTGNNMVMEDSLNEIIASKNNVEFTIVNPRTGKSQTIKYTRPVDGTFNAMTLEEESNYQSPLATELKYKSPIDNSDVSTIQYVFEKNFLEDNPNPTQEQLDQVKKLSESYNDVYKNINENDGQSWVNMFFYREYMIRQSLWTPEMENLFTVELKLLTAKSYDDIIDLTVTVDGKEIKVFDWDNWKETKDSLPLFESVHTLKPQYAGFSKTYLDYANETALSFNQRVSPYTIFKTSYHVLWPSTVVNTNLSQMHHFMLTNNVDVIHMGSANKSGAIDIKSVFKQQESNLNDRQKNVISKGFTFYDEDGYFNDTIFENTVGQQLLQQSMTKAYFNYLKDQVKIGNHEKTTIKGSTQSLKILISNLYDDGKPRFQIAQTMLSHYKEVISALVNNAINELKKELTDEQGKIELQKLVDVVKQSAEDRSSPINIIDAIEAFIDTEYIETLPNKNKVENIIYSIVTNNAISFKRPGNAYPLVASTGFEPLGSRKTMTTNNNLKFYEFDINNDGKINNLKPADIAIPIPKEWIESLLKAANTKNIAQAIKWANNRIANGKLTVTVKGLRIPNQGLSSNDIFNIKEFKLPTNVSYAIVPSEIVVKVGSDYDIDKESVYWADSEDLFNNNIDSFIYSLNEFNNYSPTDLNKVLLKLEKQILTHPRNAHFLLLPVIDDLLKKDAFDAVVSSDAKKPTTFFDALTPSKNVEKAIHFIKSKLGVGVVALDITGHSIFTSENIKTALQVYDKNGELIGDRHLMFDGMYNNDSLSSIYDASNRLISEIQSQTMTSQVDAGKDPYAVLLGINSQTLGPVMYLVRRGVPIIQILKFVSHPIVKRYLELQRINESITNKQRGKELTKQELIKKLYKEFGIQEPDPKTFYLNKELGFTDEDLDPKNKTRQYEIFKYFLEVVDETTQFNRLKNALTADTKGRKDRAAVIQFDLLWKTVVNDQLIPLSDLIKLYKKSVIAPFFKSQALYKEFYGSLYAIKNQLDNIIERTESGLKADKREKFISTLHNDFMLYLIQNYDSDFNKQDFDTLLGYTNEPSLAMELKSEEGFLFNQLYALMSVEKDSYSGKMTDIVRLFERSLNSMDTNDLIDAMLDLKTENKELYEKLIRISLYQAGFNNSPFSLTKIIPAVKSSKRKNNKLEEIELDYLYEIQKKAVNILNTISSEQLKTDIEIFEQLFFRNNPTYLRTKPNKNVQNRLFYVYDEVQNKFVIKYIPVDTRQSQRELVQLGNAYKKRYFRDEYVDIFSTVIEDEKSVLNNVFEDAFMTDTQIANNKAVIDSDIAKIKSTGKTVVFPKDGLGTGLAALKTKAPQTYAYLKQRLLEEFGFNNDTGTITTQPTAPVEENEDFVNSMFQTQPTQEEIDEFVKECKKGTMSANLAFKPLAKRGLNLDFTPGGSWTLEKDLKGYPTHAQGGVDLRFDSDGVAFHNGTHHVKASCGLCLPSLNKMKQ